MKRIAAGEMAGPRGGAPPGVVRERIYVGIDVGYREHVAAAVPWRLFNPQTQPDGWKRVRTVRFSSDAGGHKRLQAYLDRHSPHATDFLVLLEPTGGYYGLVLQMYLLGRGYRVVQVENKAVADYREKVFGSETKTDDVDARLMARMGFLHEAVGEEFSIHPVVLADPDQAALRVMVRDYRKLTKEITRRMNQLQQVVAVTFPELKAFFTTSTATPAVRRLLERFPTPAELAAASIEDVEQALRDAHAPTHVRRAEELHALARQSAGVRALTHHLWRQAWIIGQLPTLEEARRALLEEIGRITAAHPYAPIIDSLPVRSPIWTATLIAVIGDVHRFKRYDHLKAYLGWSTRKTASGTSVDASGLAKSGVRLSRHVLFLMALSLLSPSAPDNLFREDFRRMTARGVRGDTALGHVAGKLAVVLSGMLKKMQPYDAARHRRAMGLPPAPSNGAPAATSVEIADEVAGMIALPPGFGDEVVLNLDDLGAAGEVTPPN